MMLFAFIWVIIVWIANPLYLIFCMIRSKSPTVAGLCVLVLMGYFGATCMLLANDDYRAIFTILLFGPLIPVLAIVDLGIRQPLIFLIFIIICFLMYFIIRKKFKHIGFNATTALLWSISVLMISWLAVEIYVEISMRTARYQQFPNASFTRKNVIQTYNNSNREFAQWHGSLHDGNKHYHWSFENNKWMRTCDEKETCRHDKKP